MPTAHSTAEHPGSAIPSPAREDLFSLNCRGREIRLAFASPTDWIPAEIRRTGTFFEEPMLDDVREHLELLRPVDSSACIIDAGANIGNHTTYFAAVCGTPVVSIEPFAPAMDQLERNLRLNSVEHLVTTIRAAVGSRESSGIISIPQPGNIGANRVLPADAPAEPGRTPIRITTLDTLPLSGPPAVLKIDVEGAELDVLAGGRRLLAAHRPTIYVECNGRDQFEAVRAYLADPTIGGYIPVARFNDDPTYKFMPTGDDVERRRALSALAKLVWFGKFQRGEDLAANRRCTDSLQAQISALSLELARLKQAIELRSPDQPRH